MTHPMLSVDAMSSFRWSFEQDLALWRELGVKWAGLLISKLGNEPAAKFAQLRAAGIQSSTVIVNSFDLGEPASWDQTRATHAAMIDLVADTGGHSIYFTPGRTTGAPWREVLKLFAAAVAPSVAHGRKRGVQVAIEPSLRTDVSFVNTLRDAIDVAELTGVKLIADFGNMWMERDSAEVFKRAAPHLALLQICDVIIGGNGKPAPGGRVHIGEGELPIRRLMAEVLDAGYRGVFDLEVLGPLVEKEGYESALRRGIASASALLDESGMQSAGVPPASISRYPARP
jgi:sugar phosphate isomerase/epimerase